MAVDPSGLRACRDSRRTPWRVAVVGRVGSGKSTLINALTHAPVQATGLGGVTVAPAEIPLGDTVVLLDTPGIDDPDRALVALQPLLEAVDAVIWVVDGLQPMTASERDVMAACCVAGTPLTIVISKVDLLGDDDRGPVVHRAEVLSRDWAPRGIVPLDLRSAAASGLAPVPLVVPEDPGPRRGGQWIAALDAVTGQIAAVPKLPPLRAPLAAWTQAIRDAVAAVEVEISAGRASHKTDAVAALGDHALAATAGVQGVLGPIPCPRLPPPEAPSTATVAQVLAGMSGQEGARRALKAAAARWLAEGQLVLQEWWNDQGDLQAQTQALDHLVRCLDAVRSEVTSSIEPGRNRAHAHR